MILGRIGISCFLWLSLISVWGWSTVQTQKSTSSQNQDFGSWTDVYPISKDELSPIGRNPYIILEPGYTLVFADGDEQLTITVLEATKQVDSVETRIVEERETQNGKLKEVSRNYFAISKRTNSVFYFGEEVDMYKEDKIVSHNGAWLADGRSARFGLMMPGIILLRARYFQEIVPGVAMDRAEIISMNETVATPAGEFENCLKIEETTPLEPGVKEYKYYAPGIGLVQDGALKLVHVGAAATPKPK